MGDHSPRLTLTSWSRESTEQKENRTGLDPERRKSLPDLQIPNFKEQEEARRIHARNIEIEEWKSQVQDSTDIDDEIPKQSSSTLSTPLRYYPPVVFDDIPRIKKDLTEGEDIEPVSDTESVRENQVKDGQVYFNPKATGINARDRTLMQESRHWNDGPVYPYVIETKIQAQSANDTAKRWNEAADTYSVLSRTATWGTRRRSELSIADIESIHNGSFLKRFSFKTDKEFKNEREKRAHSFIGSITNIVRKKNDSSKPKRKSSARESRGRPEAGPARSGGDLQHNPAKDNIYELWKQTGGPLVAELPFDSNTRPLDLSDANAGDYSNAAGEDEEEEPADDGEIMDFDQNTPIRGVPFAIPPPPIASLLVGRSNTPKT